MGTITLSEQTAPSTPSSGNIVVYPKTDHLLYLKDSTGTESSLSVVASAGASVVLIQSQTASSSASIDFTSSIGSTYAHYFIHISALIPATDNVELYLRTSANAGSSWDSGASNYAYRRDFSGTDGVAGTWGGNLSTGDTKIQLAVRLGNSTGESLHGIIRFARPDATNEFTLNGEFWGYDSIPATQHEYTAGARLTNAAVNGIRLFLSSGNITSGRFTLYGVKFS